MFDELTCGLEPGATAPQGWEVPARPCFDLDQRFGPLTPVVLARAAQLWQADDETLGWFLDVAAVTNLGLKLSASIAMAVAVARPAGRRLALETLLREAHGLIGRLTDAPSARPRFRAVVRDRDREFWGSLDREQRQNVRRNYAGWLHDLALGCLMVEAVADRAPRPLLLQARGPWLRPVRRESVLTDPAWRAAPEVLGALHEMLDPLDAATLTLIARIHRTACDLTVIGAEGYADLVARLESWASTSAASCPWKPELSELPGWAPLLRGVPGGSIAPMRELENWATCFTAALTHRGRLSADDVRTFAVPFAEDLPMLEKVLDTAL